MNWKKYVVLLIEKKTFISASLDAYLLIRIYMFNIAS